MFTFSRHSIRFRLFLTFSLLTLLVTLTYGTLHVLYEIRSFHQRNGEKAAILAESLAGSIRVPLFADYREELLQRARESAGHAGVQQVTIFNSAGAMVAQAGVPLVPHSGGTITREAPVTSAPRTAVPGEVMVEGGDTASLGMVRLTLNTEELDTFIRALLLTSCLTALFFWGMVSYLSYWVVQWVTRSLTPLIHGLRIIGTGEYAARIELAGGDELAEAAIAVNALAETLQLRESENKRLQQELVTAMQVEVREERRRMMARLLQTNRMTSLGLMVAGMAHEINTPNAAIRLAGQQVALTWRDVVPILDRVVQEEGEFILGGVDYRLLRDEMRRAAEVIVRSGEKIDRVVKDLRNYNLGQRGELTDRVNVTQVVVESLNIVRAQGSRGQVRLVPQLAQDLPPVQGNRYQLEQVITNLLLNGMQAIPEGRSGTVTVSTGQDSVTGEITMTVSDDGAGIPILVLSHILEPFFTTRIEKGGSGLGLYISNYIITEHGGRLTIASEPGEGTAVTVSLPTAPSPPASSSPSAGRSPSGPQTPPVSSP